MKNKKNDGKYVIIDDGTAGGLFLRMNTMLMRIKKLFCAILKKKIIYLERDIN